MEKTKKKTLIDYYNQYGSLLLCKEMAFDLLRNNHQFSQDELLLLIRIDPIFALDHIPYSVDFIKAWVDIMGFVNRDTFPVRFYKDPEVVRYIISKTLSFSSLMTPYITEDMLFEFAKNHSDKDLYRLCRRLGFFSNYESSCQQKFERFISDESMMARLNNVDPKDAKYLSDDYIDLFDGAKERIAARKEEEKKLENDIVDGVINQNAFSVSAPLVLEETAVQKTNKRELTVKGESERKIIVHYISDLHLNHKIIERLRNEKSAGEVALEEIEKAVSQIVKSIKSRTNTECEKIILLGGDITEDYEISRAFYYLLSKRLNYSCGVISVLGNHELWDGDPNGEKSHNLNKIIDKYRDLARTTDYCVMLQNEIYAVVNERPIVINEDMFFDESIEVYLKRILSKATVIIFGGIGFSGNNTRFNASQGIYRGAVKSIKKDKELSNKCNAAYKRAAELIGSADFICFTHTPKTDWSDDAYLPNCIYISGHTHKNSYLIQNGKRILADNQVGYKGTEYSLKNFSLSGSVDYFQYLPDGIHEIHPTEYIEFASFKGLNYRYKRNDSSKILVLKKSGFYMFITQNKSGLCILHGGRKEKLKHRSVDYYFDNMDLYAEQLLATFQGYEDAIHRISESIKRIGGDGRVHGCIVDIDFYNHIYLNPFDGTMTSYCAPDITSRISYPTLELLIEKNPSNSPVLNRIKKQIDTSKKGNSLVLIDENKNNSGILSDGTYIYKVSNKTKKIQSLFDKNIIQMWDDNLVNKAKQKLID